MDLENKVKQQLLSRGFTKDQLLNNRGLIGATIDDTALIVVKNLAIQDVSNRLLAEKIILALDDYGRKTHSVEYGLPIDPDTKNFEDKRPKEMLKIVTNILNGC